MLISEIIWVALGAIRANLLRSFLTTLGIIIGVSAVIAMVALGEGAQRNVEEQIARMGTNVLTIRADQRRYQRADPQRVGTDHLPRHALRRGRDCADA